MVNLRDLLLEPALPGDTATFHRLPGAALPNLTHKQWVQGYHEVRALEVYTNPGLDIINNVFGLEDALDVCLLNRDVHPLNDTSEWFQSEGDSVRAFYTHISLPLQLAFKADDGRPFIIQRSESGPLGPTQVPQTVDFTWGYGNCCLIIGEMKKHGIIDPPRWNGLLEVNSNRRWLGKELRGYCHKYQCFAASVFDGKDLLILVFQAENPQQIQDQNCPVTGLLFSRDCATLRYGLFRAATYQIRRMQARTALAVEDLDGYARGFRWWSGDPYWVDGNGGEYDEHPNGYIRLLDPSGPWYWADANGNPVLYHDGERVWDMRRLW
ncbi:hypothetical protein QBC40DRAFT_216042 [Triangularia verruculosa]|uniref:Uncharacterized protein n=1 Tax=Triangularia verruculosa TaxID=2587418 RepID=A0AAN6XSE1_9PEZI|nr:hypothetical protein QBC40DRAFT_216042 [Triangularia verruculosa]